MKKYCIILLLLLTASTVKGGYQWPVKGKPMITSSFLEYRGIRGHHGMDMCTHWRAGEPILAANHGWVSSIMYQHWGIGFAVFVKHDDGYQTFYGHMSKFAKKILLHEDAKKVGKKILNQKDFRIYFKKDEIKVAKGEIVGYSGDTGSGPIHLHFELRKENDDPLNPLLYAYKIRDSSAPRILKVFLVPLDGYSHIDEVPEDAEYDVRSQGRGMYTLKASSPPIVAGRIGIKVMAYDNAGFVSKVGLYGAKIYLNNKEAYGFQFDSIERNKSHRMGLVYDRLKSTYSRYIYYMYSRVTMNGIIRTHKKGEIIPIKIVCYDANNNQAVINLKVTTGKVLDQPAYEFKPNLFPGMELKLASTDEFFSIGFDKDTALYKEMIALTTEGAFKSGVKGLTVKSKLYAVSPADICLEKPATISIRYKGKDYKKVGIYGMSTSGNYYFLDNNYDKSKKSFKTGTWTLMRYFLIRDDIPPRIRFFQHKKRLRKNTKLKIYVSDIGTGVHLGRVDLKVDDKKVNWAYEIDRHYIEIFSHNKIWDKGKHTINIEIQDVAGNKSGMKEFYYYVR